jgi:large-conductance mechanosensitive channel
MPAAIQMLAALALFLTAVVALLVSVVIGAAFVKLIHSGVRWLVQLVNTPEAELPGEQEGFSSTKRRPVTALPGH